MKSIGMALLVSTCLTAPVRALAGENAADAPAASGKVEEVQEIVVTAQKTPQAVSKVPMSISAITQDTLEKLGIKNADELGRLAPGLTFTQSGFSGQPEVSIRGLSSGVGASTTGIYIDDTPIQNRAVIAGIGAAYPRIFDLDRVEVLRGPQGTLFGAGSEGGTIRFITPEPSLHAMSGYASSDVSATDYGGPNYEGGAAVGGPIVDGKLGFRVSVWGQHQSGYIDQVSQTDGSILAKGINSSHAFVARAALLYEPIDRLTIKTSVYLQDFYKANPDQYFEDAGTFKSLYKINQPSDDRFSLWSLDVGYKFDAFSVKSITSYFDRAQSRTNDYSYFEPTAYQGGPYEVLVSGAPYNYIATQKLNSPQHNLTEEIRFSSLKQPGDRLSWIGGVFLSRERQGSNQYIWEPIGVITETDYGLNVDQFFGAPNGPIQWIEEQKFKTDEVAVFGEANYNLTKQLKLTLGLRAARTEFSFTDVQDGPEASGYHLYKGATRETPVTPKFGATYEVSPSWMTYATVAKGYRTGGANSDLVTNPTCAPSLHALGLSDSPATYGSDYVWSYEIGDKQKFFGNRLSVASSAFWIDWSKIQGSVFVQSCGLQYLTNLGSAVSRGLDLQTQAKLFDGLTLSASAGYDDAHYAKNAYQPGLAGSTPVLLAQEGDRLQNTPAWTGTVSLQYDYRLFTEVKSYVRADYQYTGAYVGSPAAAVNGYDPGLRHQNGAGVLSARAGFNRGPIEATIYANNLLNDHTSLQRSHDLAGEEAYYGVPDGLYRDVTFRPLTVGATLKYRY